MDSNGDRHPVAFMSKTFNDTKKRYEIYDRIIGNSMSTQGMATLHPRIRTYNHGTHRPQELDILLKSSEVD